MKELCVLNLFPEVKDTVLIWRVDNNAALHAIRNEGSTKSWPLSVLSCSILTRCLERNLVLAPVRGSSETQ